MARSGGTMSIPYPDFVSGEVISSSQVDANNATIVSEITNSIAADGQTTPSANLPMGGFKHTGLGAGSAAADSANFGQVQAQAYIWCGTATGTKNALILSPSPAITAYAAGQVFRFKTGATQSDDAVTIAVSGLATKAAQSNGSAMSVTIFLEASKWYEILYDGAAFQARKFFVPDGTLATTSGKLSQFAATTSAELAGVVSDETGSGALVFANTPTLVTPVLGVATATSVNKVALTAPASSATLTIANGKTLTASNTTTITSSDGATIDAGSGIATGGYTPTLSSTTNVGSSTPNAFKYIKIGTIVYVFGIISITPTAAVPTATIYHIDLPVASSGLTSDALAGSSSDVTGAQLGNIAADGSAHDAIIRFIATSTSARNHSLIFGYQII